MLFIENNRTDPYFNLAVEEYLLKEFPVTETLFLLWRNEPVVVIGRNQNTLEEIDAEVIRSEGIQVVRRLTGGGAVYHDLGNLNYTFIVPERSSVPAPAPVFCESRFSAGESALNSAGEPVFCGSAGSVLSFDFRRWTLPVLDVLGSLGVKAELSGRNDLLIEDRKFSGNAQTRISNRLLHHGTLLFRSELEQMARVLCVDSDKFRSKAVSSIRSRVTNIAEHLPSDSAVQDILEFRNYLLRGMENWTREQGESFSRYEFSALEISSIENLCREKYSTWNWNYGVSPPFDFKVSRRFFWGKLEFTAQVRRGIIEHCAFYGDFFSKGETCILAEKMKGLFFNEECLTKHLTEEDIQSIFPELSREEFLTFIFRFHS